ncbi:MAG: hypothetical protein HC831_18900 [Chloroflexia bacterium]|nr:hypothetical protein [Chloroflexia bacterium]
MSNYLYFSQPIIHYSLHLLFPGVLAWLFFRTVWEKAWIIMLVTMLIDLDHLFANPVFDPTRCSIGFHPLHSYPAIILYFLLTSIPNSNVKIIAVGLLFHMATDLLDCYLSASL